MIVEMDDVLRRGVDEAMVRSHDHRAVATANAIQEAGKRLVQGGEVIGGAARGATIGVIAGAIGGNAGKGE